MTTPSIVSMENELDAIMKMENKTLRDKAAIELHAKVDRWMEVHESTATPADKRRVRAIIGQLLHDVFNIDTEGYQPTRFVEVRTTCLATVEEKWTLRVPLAVANQIEDDNDMVMDLLSEYFVNVENVDVRDEEDRELLKVEVR